MPSSTDSSQFVAAIKWFLFKTSSNLLVNTVKTIRATPFPNNNCCANEYPASVHGNNNIMCRTRTLQPSPMKIICIIKFSQRLAAGLCYGLMPPHADTKWAVAFTRTHTYTHINTIASSSYSFYSLHSFILNKILNTPSESEQWKCLNA